MKIAIIMPLAEQRGGAELMLMHLLRANLAGPQVDYHLAFLEEGPMADEAESLGYSVQVFAAGQLRELVCYTRTVAALTQWFRQEGIEVVMAWMAKAHLYSGPAAYLAGVPAVWWQHGLPEPALLERLTARIPANLVLCCSQAAQAAQRSISPRREMHVVFPAVDLERVNPKKLPTPGNARKELGLPTAGPLIGIVCRLQHWKGVHVFLDAAKGVLSKYPDASFVVVGGQHVLERKYAEALQKQVKNLDLGHKVCFAGYQAESVLWMQALDVVVHASVKPEPFGMVVIEGMALGKTVVAAKAGGPIEVIQEGRDGFLTPPGDAPALALVINGILGATGEQRQALADAARQKASQFSTKRLAGEVAQALQNVSARSKIRSRFKR